MNMKKKVAALGLVAAMLLTSAGATLAYFTDITETEKNVFTVGNVEIELTEPNWVASGSEDAPEVYPGEALAKDPTVKNIGANPCFVRVKVEGLDQFTEKFNGAMITLRHGNYVEGYDDTNWTYNETDGYYYYNKVLATEATAGNQYNVGLTTTTKPVFNQIVMPTELTNNAEAEPIEIYVEAVQAQGARPSWSAVKAMNPAEIAAWFATCMPAEETPEA